MNKHCLGCGVLLQTTNEKDPGYVKNLSMAYCMRCFRLKHYHDVASFAMPKDNEKIIFEVNKKQSYVFFFVDVLHLEPSIMKLYQKITAPKTLVISKVDILPKSISLAKLKTWLHKTWAIKEDIFFVKKNATSAKKILNSLKNISVPNIYFLGITNSGKSSMINELLALENSSRVAILESEIPNTTQDYIKVSLQNKNLFDSVGFSYPYVVLPPSLYQKFLVTKEIKPKTYFLKPESILNIENIFFLKVNNKTSLTWFGSDKIKINKIYQEPKTNSLFLNVSSESNVIIKGLGFFYVKDACTLTIFGLKNENVSVVASFLGSRDNNE